MNKSTLIWIAVLAVVVLCGVWFAGRYNALVAEQENVEKAVSSVKEKIDIIREEQLNHEICKHSKSIADRGFESFKKYCDSILR